MEALTSQSQTLPHPTPAVALSSHVGHQVVDAIKDIDILTYFLEQSNSWLWFRPNSNK